MPLGLPLLATHVRTNVKPVFDPLWKPKTKIQRKRAQISKDEMEAKHFERRQTMRDRQL